MNIHKSILGIGVLMMAYSPMYATCNRDINLTDRYITTSETVFADNDLITKEKADYIYINLMTPSSVTAPAGYGLIWAGGNVWLDRDIGASQAATSLTDSNAYGSLFQWGRRADGHELGGASTTDQCLTFLEEDNGGLFVTQDDREGYWYGTDTLCSDNTDTAGMAVNPAWTGPAGINQVCPAGWQVPSLEDFRALDLISADDAYNKLKLVRGGYKDALNGVIPSGAAGYIGIYWTTSYSDYNPMTITFGVYNETGNQRFRQAVMSPSFGAAVRCMKHIVHR